MGNSLAPNMTVAKKTRAAALAFKPAPRRKSLIEWDPSRQAQILDWRHRAQDFGLEVDERDSEDHRSGRLEPRSCSKTRNPRRLHDQRDRARRSRPTSERRR